METKDTKIEATFEYLLKKIEGELLAEFIRGLLIGLGIGLATSLVILLAFN